MLTRCQVNVFISAATEITTTRRPPPICVTDATQYTPTHQRGGCLNPVNTAMKQMSHSAAFAKLYRETLNRLPHLVTARGEVHQKLFNLKLSAVHSHSRRLFTY